MSTAKTILKWILAVVFIAFIIGFAMQNMEQKVIVQFIKWQSVELPLWIIMYASFVGGMIFWLLVSIIRLLGFQLENMKCKKEIKKLSAELDRLRNVSVEESVNENSGKSELPMISDALTSSKE
ncbi:LapA family protein [candidate division KSB1 bacterium]|nr:LapA family protein [candidate division KSB1 bacterium]